MSEDKKRRWHSPEETGFSDPGARLFLWYGALVNIVACSWFVVAMFGEATWLHWVWRTYAINAAILALLACCIRLLPAWLLHDSPGSRRTAVKTLLGSAILLLCLAGMAWSLCVEIVEMVEQARELPEKLALPPIE